MGKRRNRKSRKRGQKNGNAASPHDKAMGGTAKQVRDARTARTISIMAELASPSIENRIQACSAIANLFPGPGEYEQEVLDTLLENDVFRKLNSRVTDSNASVRRVACGALNNISSCCGLQVRKIMNESDVTSTIFSVLRAENLGDKDEEMLLHVFQLLCNIFENNDRVQDIEQDENLNSVLRQLEIQANPSNPPDIEKAKVLRSNAAGQLLHIATDENISLARKFEGNTDVLGKLAAFIGNQDQDILTRLHLCGTLYNVSLSIKSKLDVVRGILNVFGSKEVFHEECDHVSKLASGNSGVEAVVERGLQVQALALEILTNVCCVEIPDDVDVTEDQYQCFAREHGQVVNLLVSSGAMRRVMVVAETIVSELSGAYSEKSCPETIIDLGQRAVGCLDNIVQNMSNECFDAVDKKALWDLMFGFTRIVHNRGREDEAEMLESLSALLWSLIRRAKEQNVELSLLCIEKTHIQACMRLATSPTTPVVRSNTLGLLGELCSLGLGSFFSPVIGTIANCLNDNSVSVVVQALFIMFSVFGDKTHNDVYESLKLQSVLRTLLPRLKSKAQDRNNIKFLQMDPQDIDDAIENLSAFLQYKEQESRA